MYSRLRLKKNRAICTLGKGEVPRGLGVTRLLKVSIALNI
jgi:hypothetical protein